jgi:hypothetical protein
VAAWMAMHSREGWGRTQHTSHPHTRYISLSISLHILYIILYLIFIYTSHPHRHFVSQVLRQCEPYTTLDCYVLPLPLSSLYMHVWLDFCSVERECGRGVPQVTFAMSTRMPWMGVTSVLSPKPFEQSVYDSRLHQKGIALNDKWVKSNK